jgi:protein-arginine kinase activator protein McsA
MIKHKKPSSSKLVTQDKKVEVPDLNKYLPVIAVTEMDLKNELLRCLENEEYERASRIRDILEKAKRNRDDLS